MDVQLWYDNQGIAPEGECVVFIDNKKRDKYKTGDNRQAGCSYQIKKNTSPSVDLLC